MKVLLMKNQQPKPLSVLNLKSILMGFCFILTASFLSGCGIRSIPMGKNAVDAALAEITNQQKRRADLIPNLVSVVKGYTKHERETLDSVVSARSKATSIQLSMDDLSPEKIQAYQKAQGELSQALGRLLAITENYPNLKADTQFKDLQVQLEGTENRIAVARGRLIQALQEFNNLVTVPPTSWTNSLVYHFSPMPQWSVPESEKTKVEQTPEVKF
ncbi:MAG TPA: LemA family protein [Pseudobdellovibrionaceae bacterium]|nr:LemA family protein [Pseudobdellovibrionaceae bacterium]